MFIPPEAFAEDSYVEDILTPHEDAFVCIDFPSEEEYTPTETMTKVLFIYSIE